AGVRRPPRRPQPEARQELAGTFLLPTVRPSGPVAHRAAGPTGVCHPEREACDETSDLAVRAEAHGTWHAGTEAAFRDREQPLRGHLRPTRFARAHGAGARAAHPGRVGQPRRGGRPPGHRPDHAVAKAETLGPRLAGRAFPLTAGSRTC